MHQLTNQLMGSYSNEDVTFLLKDLTNIELEFSNEEREKAIQSGMHYSEMLPIEEAPSKQYLDLFYESVDTYKERLAIAIGTVAERIIESKGKDVVLVSLARGGTPVGILIKRYLKFKYNFNVPHYSISIIRGRGIDENALNYITSHHSPDVVQFVDGWTGKGAISLELIHSINTYNQKQKKLINSSLAVLADPGHCASIYGSREDLLIPSSFLNATVSGLISRTVLNELFIGKNDFHGTKIYTELANEDVSNYFVDHISDQFGHLKKDINEEFQLNKKNYCIPNWRGLEEVQNIQNEFNIKSRNYIKPGIGETTRVLLRRVPWKILVRDISEPQLKHILLLAKEKNCEIVEYSKMSYSCCGIIQEMGDV
jgi:hypothetical protein